MTFGRFGKSILLACCFALITVAETAASGPVVHRVPVAESKEAATYWTPHRVSRAIRRDPAFELRRAPDYRLERFADRHRPVAPIPQVGKIIGRDDAGPFSCSGAVIETRSMRLILTAAHCLYFGGTWARHVVFIPGFDRGRQPYGRYRATNLWVTGGWYRRWFTHYFGPIATNYDLGVAVTRRTWRGTRVGDNVGALPVRAFSPRRGATSIYGYPAGAMRGRVLRNCRSWSRPNWMYQALPGPIGRQARCDMARGSSGGPWVARYSDRTGSFLAINGLTSTGFKHGGRSFMTSPYLGSAYASLVNAAEGR